MYVEERKATKGITDKSLGEFKTRMSLFQELIGDPDVKALNRRLFVDCLNKVVRIPSRRNQLAEYRDKTIDELLALDSVPHPLGIKTVRNHFSSLSTLLTWAEQNEYIAKNPAKCLMPKDDRGDEELRIPYEDDELKKMVNALTEQRKEKDLKPFRWLIPLVSLFSGLRADEVCQLYKEDIREVDGVWVFDVNDKGDKKVKTKNSKRLVPIHPQLIELRLLDYISSVDHERVWPELTLGSRGYSHNWTDWYGAFNREYISNDPRKVFHSLRKNFANNLKQNMIHDTVLAELMGHDVQSLGMSVYSNKYEVQVLHKEILRLSFDLDVSGLMWSADHLK
jgi:integrase